jgi:L-2-hydroxyglutarate oxidase LhgO
MADVDIVVVGAGVIGLAIARRFAIAGLSTVIIETESAFGSATSSRNSEVIHAGLYYGGTPLKERLCTQGRQLLYQYCAAREVPHRRLGKLIIAFEDDEVAALEKIAATGRAAGVDDLRFLSGEEASRLEPELACHAALFSPSTGIIDSHAYMLALLHDAESAGAVFARRTTVTHLSRAATGWAIHVAGEDEPVLTSRYAVNTAGHGAQALAMRTEGLPDATIPPQYYARGNYFVYTGKVPFTHLIYPVPVRGGLGTHLTLDMSGAARFGPDVEWIDGIDYRVDESRGSHFRAAAQRIWPALRTELLVPGYSGIRPKLGGPGDPAADFVIQGPEAHGLSDLVVLYGIESPGLTASLAIANEVAQKLQITT